ISTQRVSIAKTPRGIYRLQRLDRTKDRGRSLLLRPRQTCSESKPQRGDKVVLHLRIILRRRGELIAGTNDEVVPRPKVETTQNQLRRYQDLVQAGALPVRKIGVTDLDCGPKVFPEVILESRVPDEGIAEIALGRNSNGRSLALRSRRAKIVLHRD